MRLHAVALVSRMLVEPNGTMISIIIISDNVKFCEKFVNFFRLEFELLFKRIYTMSAYHWVSAVLQQVLK